MGAMSDRRAAYKKEVGELTAANAAAHGLVVEAATKTFRTGTRHEIDHIVPKSFGFKHDIPPRLMGSPVNLRVITSKENLEKGQRITADSIAVLREWGYFDLADVYEHKTGSSGR